MQELVYANTTSWEAWQREYRFGAFYIFPPPGIIEGMDRLREIHDPRSASICQAHISISFPLPRAMTETDVDEISRRLSFLSPFQIQYGPLRSFLPHPGVVYAISPVAAFDRLRSTIHAAPVFTHASRGGEGIAPHITIAEFITAEETTALLASLSGTVPQGSFLCESIEFAVPNDEFRFERIRSLPLGRTL